MLKVVKKDYEPAGSKIVMLVDVSLVGQRRISIQFTGTDFYIRVPGGLMHYGHHSIECVTTILWESVVAGFPVPTHTPCLNPYTLSRLSSYLEIFLVHTHYTSFLAVFPIHIRQAPRQSSLCTSNRFLPVFPLQIRQALLLSFLFTSNRLPYCLSCTHHTGSHSTVGNEALIGSDVPK